MCIFKLGFTNFFADPRSYSLQQPCCHHSLSKSPVHQAGCMYAEYHSPQSSSCDVTTFRGSAERQKMMVTCPVVLPRQQQRLS